MSTEQMPRDVCVSTVRQEAYHFGNIHYYFSRVLVDELGPQKGKQLLRKAVYNFAVERGRELRKKAEQLGLAPTQENWRKITDIPFIAWVGEGKYKCPYGWAWLEKAKADPQALEFGFLYCIVNDPTVANTFNPSTEQLTFTRHVLWGDDFCDRITESGGIVVADTLKERTERETKGEKPRLTEGPKTISTDECIKNVRQMMSHSANLYYHYANVITEETGKVKGREIITEAVKRLASERGRDLRKKAEELGIEPTLDNFSKGTDIVFMPPNVKDAFYCPYGDVWNRKGELGRELGLVYCEANDAALLEAYNPELKQVKFKKHVLRDDGRCERTLEYRGNTITL
ncbi:MAG: L-2-amino-thiazoline-4-carboxylic acid hydrolase [archaeon]